MSEKYRWLGVVLATVLLTGCGGDSSDYSNYVTLGEYKNLSADLVVTKVTDEELREYENDQLDEYVSYEDVSGPVKEGQLVQMSLIAKEGDEAVYDFSEDGYELIVGDQDFGEAVDAALIGTEIGDVLDFSVTYDDEFEDVMLCGKEIDFHIEIQNISDVVYPELTNEFIKENFGEESVDAWQETLAQELQSEHQAEATENLRNDLVQQVVDGSKISGYPKDLYAQKSQEIESGYQGYADMLGCSLNDVYEMFDLDEEARKQECLTATNQTMVLALIREQEHMTLSDEELQEKLQEFAEENDYDTAEELLSDYDEEDLKQYFLDELTKDFLEEHAQISTSQE